MALYYVPRAQSVTITPNPVGQNQTFRIAATIADLRVELFPYVSFADNDNLSGADYVGRTLGKKEYVYAGDAYAGEETNTCQ